MKKSEIPYYDDYLSPAFREHLAPSMRPVPGVPGLEEVGVSGGLESKESLTFLCDLYREFKNDLSRILKQRITDRQFIDERTRVCHEKNKKLHVDFLSPDYETVIGHEDGHGRIVIGPKNEFYSRPGYGKPVAPIPEFLSGSHVTLFGPPDDAKLSVNAMNAYHRKLKDEPKVVEELLVSSTGPGGCPKWGADDEDSKTPLREDLITAGENLSRCLDGELSFTDPASGKSYSLAADHLSAPIKRFPGLALPSFFLFLDGEPLPLHLYDFAMHFYRNWKNKKALAFYVPKLENEEEAAYIRKMVEAAERRLKAIHPEYEMGTVRLFIVLENPRAIFRTNEIMDALYPYFAGASLGWHDYLASTARLFKNEPHYRIPVKADPNIVIKYIKASHDLLNQVVGSRGGIKIGGMYGVLPIDGNLWSPSFQITMKGFFKDVVTQLKRNLTGFWVAHPDFVRIGIAVVEAWRQSKCGDSSKLESLVRGLLLPEHQEEILHFIHGPDLVGLSVDDPLYARSLVVADLKVSDTIPNHDLEEVRYNVFQSLQYLTDWLSGNGCVALPAEIGGVPVRVMDDLATAERSRWEVWHEVHHGRVSIEDFLRIAHEEMHFIRKDLSDAKKIVQVKWSERTSKWYPVAYQLMVRLMTASRPVEFATELLLPFTVESARKADDPWKWAIAIDPEKFRIEKNVERFDSYFSVCGSVRFAQEMSAFVFTDLEHAQKLIHSFSVSDVNEAARFHGDIGEPKKGLDAIAAKEQARVLGEGDSIKNELLILGRTYLDRFGFKYLISAQGKSASEILSDLTRRLRNTPDQELQNARNALWEISLKRLKSLRETSLAETLDRLRIKHGVVGASVSVVEPGCKVQGIAVGEAVLGSVPATPNTAFEIASLSKTIASVFALEYFRKRSIGLDASVNALLETTDSNFRLTSLVKDHPEWAARVSILNLMKHNALNMHYVNGIPANQPMPGLSELLHGNDKFNYERVVVLNEPGRVFKYSGGGFLVLEHLIESLEKKSITEVMRSFLTSLGLSTLNFDHGKTGDGELSNGYLSSGESIQGGRLNFPGFAAGAMSSASDITSFLVSLTHAFHNLEGSGPITHETAVRVLGGGDPTSQEFMGVNLGLGVFIAEAGSNRLAVHQGANDGFRALFVHCFQGPDQGKGFTILSNGDLNGVLFVVEVAQVLLKELSISGVDKNFPSVQFSTKNVPSEEIVNRAYRDLIFKNFEADLPEAILAPGEIDPFSKYNRAVGARIIYVSNQRFARAENFISPRFPVFDPELYGLQGKTMDSWESVRHNPLPEDFLILETKAPVTVKYISFSTEFHDGNHAPAAILQARNSEKEEWLTLIPKTELLGHSLKRIRIENSKTYSLYRVSMIPDGGFTRIGIYDDELPESEKKKYLTSDSAKSERFKYPIPHSVKPLTAKFSITPER